MQTLAKNPIYCEIVDNLGDRAEIKYMNDGNHVVNYFTKTGVKFWTEIHTKPIEEVEVEVLQWAEGKRELI